MTQLVTARAERPGEHLQKTSNMEKVIYTTLTVTELREVIQSAVRAEKGNDSFQEKESTFNEKLINRKKLMQLLGISAPTVIIWEKEGRIKSYRLGRKLYYNLDEIENLILSNTHRAEAVVR